MKLIICDRYTSLITPAYINQSVANRTFSCLKICIVILFLFSLFIPVKILAQSTKTFTVNTVGDESDPNAGEIGDDGVCDVDPNTPGNQCTFRAAIQNQNGNRNLGQNRINFEIPNAPGVGSIVIKIGSTGLGPLPAILGAVFISAKNNDDRRIELDGSMAGTNAIGLRLLGGDCYISFFVINNFSSHGIFISGTPPPGEGRHRLESNYIGTDATGTMAKGNGGDGIFIDNTPGNTIGGTGILRNIIAGNEGYGINISGLDPSQFGTNGASNNLATGNLIGLDVSGDNALPNKKGAVLLNNAPNNTIGGAGENQGNKMAGNSTSNGITITGSLTEGIKILGNFIGDNKTGAKFQVGISALSAKPIIIEGNIITDILGVGVDIFVNADGSYNIRKNSFSGEMKVGTKLRFSEGRTVQIIYENNFHTGNGMAIDAVESINGKIDWLVAGDTMRLGQTGANFIFHAAGNKVFNSGIYESNAGVAFNYVVDITNALQMTVKVNGDIYRGNGAEGRKGHITLKAGTEFSYAIVGSSAVNNGKDGDRIDLFADVNAIATIMSTDNRYAFNAGAGIRWISDGKNLVTVRGFIERDIIDNNTISGVEVTSFFLGKSILDNTITNNGGPGVLVNGTTVAHIESNTISGNGTGILVADAATAGITTNTITANGKGIALASTGIGSGLTANSIFNNNGLGIDLGNDGPTPNDAGDADAGPNNLQNSPVLTAVNQVAGGTNVQGNLNSTPNTLFRLDIFSNDACSPTGFGEGKTFVDSFKVATDANGNAVFATLLPGVTLPPGGVVTATATDPGNNTSEFSACLSTGNIPTADLELTKLANKAQYIIGDQVTYTVRLINKGPATATGIAVTDILPAGITFGQATVSTGTYDNITGKWLIPTLNGAQQATLTITGTAIQPGSITNTAEVSACHEPDPDSSPGNGVGTEDDQSSVVVQVTQQPDITEQYRLLLQQITTLVNNGKLTPLQGRILRGFVDLSLRLESRNQIQPAITVLNVFIIVVKNATNRTHLTDSDRKALVLAAQKIIAQLKAILPPPSAWWKEGHDNELMSLENDAITKLLGFSFNGNYPNPFSSFTTISFKLSDQSKVQVNVYDENGRMTTRLLDKTMQPGAHTITWRTPDLPAGIYILQVKIDNFTKTYKMMHTKQ